MKRTLLQIVQNILSDMDSEDVNSISDSVEAEQVASVVRDVYFNMVSTRMIPEHKELFKLTSLSNSALPTHFSIPDNVMKIEKLRYNTDTSGGVSYKDIKFVSPLDFISLNTEGSNTLKVSDLNGGTTLFIRTDRMPTYFTSFDDEHIVMDAFDVSYSSTLSESNTQAYGQRTPSFTISDSFIPDVDDVMFPYLIAESKSTCFSLFKSGVDQKIEQAARRQKSYVQNDMYRIHRENKRPKYGRG